MNVVVDDDSFGHVVDELEAGVVDGGDDGVDVGLVGLGGFEGGVGEPVFEHSVNGGPQVSADGGASGFRRALHNAVQSLFVVLWGGCDECDQVGPLCEA